CAEMAAQDHRLVAWPGERWRQPILSERVVRERLSQQAARTVQRPASRDVTIPPLVPTEQLAPKCGFPAVHHLLCEWNEKHKTRSIGAYIRGRRLACYFGSLRELF